MINDNIDEDAAKYMSSKNKMFQMQRTSMFNAKCKLFYEISRSSFHVQKCEK